MPISLDELRAAGERALANEITIQKNLMNEASFMNRACGDMLEYKARKAGTWVEAEHANIKPISSIDTTAFGPKDNTSYSWFSYTGDRALTLKSQGGSTLVLNKGDKFGTRPSGNGKFIRLIGEKTGVTKVFTLAFDAIVDLINHCKPTRAVLSSTEELK